MLYYLLYPLSKHITGFNYFSTFHFALHLRQITALLITSSSAAHHSHIARPTDRPAGAQRRPTDASQEARHADHGRIDHSHRRAVADATLGQSHIFVAQVIVATLWMGVVGFIDDYLKVVKNGREDFTALQNCWTSFTRPGAWHGDFFAPH
jgi:phospho-N-acetylmuramoyl-pentapeptide-transferase